MSQSRTVEEKFSDWRKAYYAVRDEITPEPFRALTSLAEADNIQSINVGMTAARVVFANDRAAATVASLLTANGVKPVGFDYGDDPE